MDGDDWHNQRENMLHYIIFGNKKSRKILSVIKQLESDPNPICCHCGSVWVAEL